MKKLQDFVRKVVNAAAKDFLSVNGARFFRSSLPPPRFRKTGWKERKMDGLANNEPLR